MWLSISYVLVIFEYYNHKINENRVWDLFKLSILVDRSIAVSDYQKGFDKKIVYLTYSTWFENDMVHFYTSLH